ncbi:hypothetical protein [Cohnella sp. GCM10012308]|uniref:hypothetical protein n=1 Tax=Cohnella sp. GCM10012308 TaxID=3317329 RepID=UPI00361887C3
MAIFTSILNLLKKNPATDGADTFNIQTMLNDNWDKIDAAMALKGAIGSVRAATASNTTLSGLQTVDGVSLAGGDRVLVKNQTTGSQNGIYVAASGAWARAADADSSAKLAAGLWGYVREGTINGGKSFVLSNAGAVTLGTTALTFSQVSGAGAADDTVIGSRTATDSVTPAMSGTLTGVLSSLFTLVKGITGKSSALTGPAITLEATKSHVDAGLAHGAVSAPTASTMMARDSAGRSQVAAPSAAADIARKDTVDAAIATAASDATTKANSAQAAAIAAAATDATTKANVVQSNLTAHIGTGGAAHAAATSSVAGFMSAADKTKLDGLASGAGGAGTATDAVIGNRTISDATAPTGDTGSLTILLGWLANMITAITGGANWRTAPVKSLAALNTEKASLASPTFTGTPAAPTAAAGTNTTQIATTAFATAANTAHAANNSHIPFAVATGSANVYAVTISPAPAALTAGLALAVQINVANTGATSINVNGLGVKDVLSSKGLALTSGKLVLNGVYTLRYNGTAFILQGEGGDYGTAAAAQVLTGYTVGTDTGLISGAMPNNGSLSYTPGASVLTIPAGYTNGGTVAAVANLSAGNVKAGQTVGGVAGNFTSDGTAAAGDVANGKTAYVNGNKLTGTIPDYRGLPSLTMTYQTVKSMRGDGSGNIVAEPTLGVYGPGLNSSGFGSLIAWSADYLPANIRSGKNMWGVIGTYGNYSGTGYPNPFWNHVYSDSSYTVNSTVVSDWGDVFISTDNYVYKFDKYGVLRAQVYMGQSVALFCSGAGEYVYGKSGSTIYLFNSALGYSSYTYPNSTLGFMQIRYRNGYVYAAINVSEGGGGSYRFHVLKLTPSLSLVTDWALSFTVTAPGYSLGFLIDNNETFYWFTDYFYGAPTYKCAFGAAEARATTLTGVSSTSIYNFWYGDVNDNGTRAMMNMACYDLTGTGTVLWQNPTGVYLNYEYGYGSKYAGGNVFGSYAGISYGGTTFWGFAKYSAASASAISVIYKTPGMQGSNRSGQFSWGYNGNAGIFAIGGSANNVINFTSENL